MCPQQAYHLGSYLLQEAQVKSTETESFTGDHPPDNFSKGLREVQLESLQNRDQEPDNNSHPHLLSM